ncbi:lantibiotic dehydratase [Nocardiopsis exhalans]
MQAVSHATPGLSQRVTDIVAGKRPAPEVRKAAVSITRYMLRSHRPTPFGLFAGVAPARFTDATALRWGGEHHAHARIDSDWLEDIVHQLESDPDLLDRLPVVATNLLLKRGSRLQFTHRLNTVTLDSSAPVREVLDQAKTPVRFCDLVDHLACTFGAQVVVVRPMVAALVRLGVLITSLRAPSTVTDPLRYIVDQVHTHGVTDQTAPLVTELDRVLQDLDNHNSAPPAHQNREALHERMRVLSPRGRTPVSVDLHLDVDVDLPSSIAEDMAEAASTLLRLSPRTVFPQWEQYHAAFLDRYGTGARVPLTELVHPDTGLGLPRDYPGSTMPKAEPVAVTDRDTHLMTLVQEALQTSSEEIVLDDTVLARLSADLTPRVPPHVEMKARIHAPTLRDLDHGTYALTVTPAYHAGVFTGRFTAPDSSRGRVFANLPTSVEGALPVQVASTPAYAHAQNVGRVDRFTEHTIVIGEHPGTGTVIPLEELAVTADWGRLYLLWRNQVVEPAAFHALALEKQPPILAQFLVNVARGTLTPFLELDWGAAKHLPYLPQVRRGRAILHTARWRLTSADLASPSVGTEQWDQALKEWAHTWALPQIVELRHGDQTLVLDRTVAVHRAILRFHLDQEEVALLHQVPAPSGDGWCQGRPHEVVTTLLSTQALKPAPKPGVEVTSQRDQLPASSDAHWLSAKIFGARDRQRELLTQHLPQLISRLGDRQVWFIRYWDSSEHDHLRLRIAVTNPEDYGSCATQLGAWTEELRSFRLCRHLTLDTYRPESGRYGTGPALEAAEKVFVADTRLVTDQLSNLSGIDPVAVGAAGAFHIATAFWGTQTQARDWFIDNPVHGQADPTTRATTTEALALITRPAENSLGETSAAARKELAQALRGYREQLPEHLDADHVLSSLVHMHHNRWFGAERATERAALKVARAVALSLRDRKKAP